MKKILLLSLVCVMLSGCAIAQKDNRHLSKLVEDNMWPESTGGKWAAAPAVVPLWVVAAVVDAVVINPVASFPKAYRFGMAVYDTIRLPMPGEFVLYPVRLLGFAGGFVGAEVVHCCLPLPRRRPPEPEPEAKPEAEPEAE